MKELFKGVLKGKVKSLVTKVKEKPYHFSLVLLVIIWIDICLNHSHNKVIPPVVVDSEIHKELDILKQDLTEIRQILEDRG